MSRIFVVCEAPADQRTACDLADRVLVEAHPWADGVVDTQRTWIGVEPATTSLLWKHVKDSYRNAGLPQYIPRDEDADDPSLPDTVVARKALRLAIDAEATAALLIRDIDDQPSRRWGLDRARAGAPSIPCVIGAATCMREAWVLNGFVPDDDAERALLTDERKNLGFDPTVAPENLTAKDERAKRSPKRVVRALTSADGAREAACWRTTPLDDLRARGTGSGLTQFLDEVRARLAPLIAPVHP